MSEILPKSEKICLVFTCVFIFALYSFIGLGLQVVTPPEEMGLNDIQITGYRILGLIFFFLGWAVNYVAMPMLTGEWLDDFDLYEQKKGVLGIYAGLKIKWYRWRTTHNK